MTRAWQDVARLAIGVVFALLCAAQAQAQIWTPPSVPNGADVKWGCYDPYPGRPTATERAAFIRAAVAGAQEAEASYGVPAPALAAMAMVESGYGFTRIALFANNYFGWKAKEGDPAAYRLTCQPTNTDPNADYVRFKSLAEAMDRVAARLATSSYYKADTAQYQADRKSGVDLKTAVQRWVTGISDPYNGDPKAYVETLKRIMNDPVSPSATENPKSSLYVMTYGKAFQAALAAIGSRMDPGARYLDNCIDGSGATVYDLPNYVGRPVRACIYQEGGLKGFVYTLHPTKVQLATWIQAACDLVPHVDGETCAKGLFNAIWLSNNAQFPVAGNVIEDGAAAGCTDAKTYYNINFRDGVAVKLDTEANFCLEGQRDLDKQKSEASQSDVRYYFVARVAALTLAGYEKETGLKVPKTHVIHSKNGPHPTGAWADASRTAYLQALDTGRYNFLDAKAKGMFPKPSGP